MFIPDAVLFETTTFKAFPVARDRRFAPAMTIPAN